MSATHLRGEPKLARPAIADLIHPKEPQVPQQLAIQLLLRHPTAMSLRVFFKNVLNLARAVVERVGFSGEDPESAAIEVEVRTSWRLGSPRYPEPRSASRSRHGSRFLLIPLKAAANATAQAAGPRHVAAKARRAEIRLTVLE